LGRRTWGTVLLGGVQNGITTGLIMSLIFWAFMPVDNIWALFLYALAIGVLVGVVFAALSYWMSQGKRDFTSVSQTVATKYEILAEHKVAAQAREMARTMPGAALAAFTPAPPMAGAYAAPQYPPPAPQAPPAAPEPPSSEPGADQPPQQN
jgi:predicted lipid-binding transport protein (Tim44 family)